MRYINEILPPNKEENKKSKKKKEQKEKNGANEDVRVSSPDSSLKNGSPAGSSEEDSSSYDEFAELDKIADNIY